MLKCEELRNEESCLNKAKPDELIFVLRSNDVIAPQTVRLWAAMAMGVHQADKIQDALVWADRAEKQREERAAPMPSDPATERIKDFGLTPPRGNY